MAVKYKRAGAHNWTDDAGWSTTSGGAADTVAPTAADDAILDASSGNVTISATSVGKSLTCTGYTGTFTHNAFNLTLSGSATFVSGMTYTPLATSTLTFNAAATLTTGGKAMPLIAVTSGLLTLGDNLTFMASKLITLTLSGNLLDINGKTVSGDSATNRPLIRSNTLGTPRTITNTTGTFANVDFRDITFSTNADYSAITGLSGDCGGNSGATLTTGTTRTYTGGTGSWSDSTKWTGSVVPLPQDNVSMAGVTGGTITADMPRLGKSIDWTGASGSPTFSVTTAPTIYGSFTLISAMTFSCSVVFTIEGRGTHTITSSTKSFGANVTFTAFGGTYTLQDNFSMTAGTFFLSNGTLNANSKNITTPIFSGTGSTTRALNITNSIVTLSSTSATSVWSFATLTGLTLTTTGSTIAITNTGANASTFAGGGGTYNDLKISGGGAGAIIITGANTFNRIYTDGGGTKSITLPGSTTTTIISGAGLNNGTNIITFTASAGSATVAKSGAGIVNWDYVNLTNIPASTASTWYAGTHSVDGTGNTNWSFTAGTTNERLKNGQGVVLLADSAKYANSALKQQGWTTTSDTAVQPSGSVGDDTAFGI